MNTIRVLNEEEIKSFAEIIVNAYPGWVSNTPGEREKLENDFLKTQREDSNAKLYGLFRENKLLGGMRLHDFKMRLGSKEVEACGLGMVAVHLMHKKEKVAKEMVSYFIRHYRERRTPIAMLYPFNPEFYKRMGFGFGTKMNQYAIKPKSLPKGGEKRHISFFEEEDKQLLWDCYARAAENTNGMLVRSGIELDSIINNPQNKIVIYKKDDKIEGYIIFMFKKASQINALKNDIFVKEFIYENSEALRSILTFLNTQEDQINRIIFNTMDESFYHMLPDPGDGSDKIITAVYHESNLQGVGLMYRVTDIRILFEALKEHNFNNLSCKIRLNISDSFIEENNKSIIVNFINGRVGIAEEGEYDTTIDMNIADFSSLIVGAVGFKALVRYGLVNISDDRYIDIIDKIFNIPEKPICFTVF